MNKITSFLKHNLLRQGRLQVRLTLLMLAVAAPLLIASVVFITLRARDQMERDADEQLQLLNRSLSTNTATWLDFNIRALTELNTLPAIISQDAEQQKPLLETMQAAYPHMYLISTTDTAGLNIARSDDVDPKDYSDRYWVQNAVSGAPLTYQTLVGRTSGEPALVVSVPMHNADGEIIGVSMFASDLTDITAEANISRIGDTGFAYIVDSTNQVLAHPNPELTANLVDFSDDPPVVFAREGHTGLMTFTDDNGDTWRAYTRTLDNDWVVVVRQQEDEFLNALNRFQQVALTALVVGIVLLVILSGVIIRRALSPVRALTETATAIAEGDLNRTAPVVSRDEIGTLATTFNSMTEQLRGLIGGLEERVNARTRDLQIAADVSRQITTVLDLDDLLTQVAQLTATSFGFYVTSVFLIDKERQVLVRAAGADDKGQPQTGAEMTIPLDADPSVIARAAHTRTAVNVPNVAETKAFLFMPEFPNTKSELAIPIMLGDRVLGVFDLQAEALDRFSPDDLSVLTTLAEQIAVAVRNAQLFAEAGAARELAEQANQVKSQFLAAMSHELRTPLNGILNFTQFVSSGMMGPINERQTELLNKATANGEHLLSLINDVLDISKIESGSLKLFVEDNIDLREIIEQVAATGRSLLEGKPVELYVEISDDLPTITADKRRVHQILLNLVSNACKFTETGSITIQATRQDGHILFTVKDTGPGIAPKEQESVFAVFSQTDAGLKRGEGTGLGMPISKRLAENMGGRLWMESAPGAGSTFYVTLPLRISISAQVATATEEAAAPEASK